MMADDSEFITRLIGFGLSEKEAQTLESWKAWNTEYYAAVLVIILVALAAMNLGKGLNGLLGGG
jgi:hypothetical protein